MNPIIQTLKDSGAFLHVSRTQPESLDAPLEFTLEDGLKVHIDGPGIITFEPAQAQHKDIALSCGVHGNETAPIEICDEFVRRMLLGDLRPVHRLHIQFGNLPAMDIGERFVEENMNRLFSGAHSQGPGLVNQERERARQLEISLRNFFEQAPQGESRTRIHYDLHTAIRASKNEKFAVYPFLHGKPHDKTQLAFMGACGVRTILLSESPTTTYSYFSSYHLNAHAFTVELGKVRPFGENDMTRFEDARLALLALISQTELSLPHYDAAAFDIYRVNQVINKRSEDFVLTFADDTPNFSDYPAGHILATDGDIEHKTEHDGEAIVFPNANVAIGQRAILTVIPAEIQQ